LTRGIVNYVFLGQGNSSDILPLS